MIVFDIDGTLADCKHRLHYISRKLHPTSKTKDYPAFYAASIDDTPIEVMCDIAAACIEEYLPIAFVTGRPNSIREITNNWLVEHIAYEAGKRPLLMRMDNDYRPDTVVKVELIQQLDDIELAFEDRPRVAQAYRELGINVALISGWEE